MNTKFKNYENIIQRISLQSINIVKQFFVNGFMKCPNLALIEDYIQFQKDLSYIIVHEITSNDGMGQLTVINLIMRQMKGLLTLMFNIKIYNY